MSYSLGGILPYSIPFLVKMPDLLCRRSPKEAWVACSKEEACSGHFLEYKIDKDSVETITNWITSMDLV